VHTCAAQLLLSSFSLFLLPLRIFLHLSLAHLLNFASFPAFLSLLFYVPHYLLLCLTYSHLFCPLLSFFLPPVQCSQEITYRVRGEIGGVYLHALLAGALHYNFARDGDSMKGGVRAPPTLTWLGCFYHHDGIYVRK
jgi:hypothetical protein